MGRDLYEMSPSARRIFDQADATLGFSLTQLCFEGPREELTATENAQPALLISSIALFAALAADEPDAARLGANGAVPSERRGHGALVEQHAGEIPSVSFVAGHSLGEYTAVVAAGALDLATALRLVRRRGELMAAATAGTMAAVIGMDEAPLEAICREASADDAQVVIANYNSPGQLVISGALDAVARAVDLAKEQGAKRVMPLKVSAAFHSPLMREATAGLATALANAPIADAQVPIIANVSAEPMRDAEAIRRELITQVTAPVRWTASVQRMVAEGVSTFIEIGPGNVLTRLIKRIAPEARLVNICDAESMRAFLEEVQV